MARIVPARPLEVAETLSTVAVCRITGATYRQLDYWCRCGWVDGQDPWMGSGQKRRWTVDQVTRVERLVQASRIKATRLDELADRLVHLPRIVQ